MSSSDATPPLTDATRATTSTTDAVVIGGGIMGCSIAWQLARRGRRVVVIDRGPGPGLGSTSSSSAIVRFNYSTLDSVRLAWESGRLWRDWPSHVGVTDELGMARFVRTGMLVLDSPLTPLSAVRANFDIVGVPYEALTPAVVHERWPAIDLGRYYPPKPIDDDAFWAEPDGELAAYATPDGGFVDDPALAAHNLMVAAEAAGATFRFRTEVTGIAHDDRVLGVLLGAELLTAPVVVNAAGPHSRRINALAGLPADRGVQTRPMRQEVHVVPSPPGFSLGDGGVMIADTDLGTYMRPQPAGTLLVGGVEAACDELEWLDDPDTCNEQPTAGAWQTQTTRAARRIPSLGVPNRPTGLGAVYDVSDDWLPIYDRSDLAGFYLAIGTSGNQFKNAPMVGLLLAEVVEACEGGHDHDLDPVHVTGPATGQHIDVGHFSRRRRVLSTTNSVFG